MKKECIVSVLFLVISFLSPVLFMLLFLSENRNVERITLNDAEEIMMVEDYSIDTADIIDGNIYIDGWLLETSDSIEDVNRSFFLSDDKNIYKMNTVMKERIDVTEIKNNGQVYNNCGIVGNGLAKKISAGNYQIGILIYGDEKERFFFTDRYLEVFEYE